MTQSAEYGAPHDAVSQTACFTSIQIITLFSNTFILCLLLEDRIQSSHSHKTDKIIFPRSATTP